VLPGFEPGPLRDVLRARKFPCADKIYAGVGHGFVKGNDLDWRSVTDAHGRIGAFLREHLAQKLTNGPAKGK
jgi:hypothetical protein